MIFDARAEHSERAFIKITIMGKEASLDNGKKIGIGISRSFSYEKAFSGFSPDTIFRCFGTVQSGRVDIKITFFFTKKKTNLSL